MSTQQSQRELVYCHSCENEWHRDEHGLICPECHSDVVEIIEADHDPRQEMHEGEEMGPFPGLFRRTEQESTPTSPGHPGMVQHEEIDGDGHVVRRRIHFSSQGAGSASNPHDMVANIINGLFSQISGMTPGQAVRNEQAQQARQERGQTGGDDTASSSGVPPTPTGSHILHPGTGLPVEAPYTRGPPADPYTRPAPPPPSGPQVTHRTFAFGPLNMSFTSTRRTFVNGQETDDDLGGLMMNAFGPRGTQTAHDGQPDAFGALSGPLGLILSNLGMTARNGQIGDYVMTNEGIDRIITQMMEQNQQSTAPPPAPSELIDALPKVKGAKDKDAECAICISKVEPDEEVAILPCNHSYHTECIRAWLSEHDSCPACRRGITPRDGPADRPRNEGEMPRHWQAEPSSPSISRSNTMPESTAQGQDDGVTSSAETNDADRTSTAIPPTETATVRENVTEGMRDWIRNGLANVFGRGASSSGSGAGAGSVSGGQSEQASRRQHETSSSSQPQSHHDGGGSGHGLENPDVD